MEERKYRVLFIGTLPPPVHGSAVVSQQIKESKVINDAFDADWINLGTSRVMDEIGKNTLVKPFRLLSALCKEFWYLLTRRYDLCYLAITCHGCGFLKDSPFVLMCKLFCKKIVIHQHNKGMANDVDRWPYRWLLPLCYKKVKVILLSWYLYPDIEMIVKKENVLICPNGIKVDDNHDHNYNESRIGESTKMLEESRAKIELSRHAKEEGEHKLEKVPSLLFLSNLIESKGVLVLLDSLKILKDKGYSFICDYVGGETKDIDAKRFNEEVKKRDLNDIANYLGRKYGKEKIEAFRNADIFVLPTMNDCFPLVILEAMRQGLPIVTTAVGGIPDIVDDEVTGLIAQAGDSQSLTVCLEKLIINDKLRKRMGDEGRKKLEKEFTEEAFEENLLKLLRDVVQPQKQGGTFTNDVCQAE
jgi:glycosyltransferase involved in cell wall biosynthesis